MVYYIGLPGAHDPDGVTGKDRGAVAGKIQVVQGGFNITTFTAKRGSSL